MAKRKKVNLDSELKKVEVFDYPKVARTPAGYPPLLAIQGKTWYERAKNYERIYGKKVEPIVNTSLVDGLNKEEKDG